MKITDKMRLDWLDKKYQKLNEEPGVFGLYISSGSSDLREAIDAYIRKAKKVTARDVNLGAS